MKATKAFKQQPAEMNLNEIALRYKALKEEEDRLAKLLEGYRARLETAALAKGGLLETEHFKIAVTPSIREVFSLKEARNKIGGKLLAQFTRTTQYNRLKVTERRAKDEAEAA